MQNANLFDRILAIVNAVVSAGIQAFPLFGPLADLINKLTADKDLTPEERDELAATLQQAIADREARIPLVDRYPDPSEG